MSIGLQHSSWELWPIQTSRICHHAILTNIPRTASHGRRKQIRPWKERTDQVGHSSNIAVPCATSLWSGKRCLLIFPRHRQSSYRSISTSKLQSTSSSKIIRGVNFSNLSRGGLAHVIVVEPYRLKYLQLWKIRG